MFSLLKINGGVKHIMEQAMTFSSWIIMIVGILVITLTKHLPESLMVPDINRYEVKNPILFKRAKQNQLSALGIYFILVGLLSLLNLKNSIIKLDNVLIIINALFFFLIPFVIISKTENKLKSMYKLKINED